MGGQGHRWENRSGQQVSSGEWRGKGSIGIADRVGISIKDEGGVTEEGGSMDREAVVQLLLEKSGDIHAQGGTHSHVLAAVAAGSHMALIQLFLEKHMDVHAQGGQYGNALQAASAGSHEAVTPRKPVSSPIIGNHAIW